jgi:hypothetical protein
MKEGRLIHVEFRLINTYKLSTKFYKKFKMTKRLGFEETAHDLNFWGLVNTTVLINITNLCLKIYKKLLNY